MLYQSDILTSLAYMLGERSVNSTTSAPRARFIQMTLDEAYGAHPWRFARATATLSISSGIATLPTTYDDNHAAQALFDSGATYKLDPVHGDDEGDVSDGDRACWIEVLDDGVTYILHTKDSDVSTVRFKYQKKAPTLDTNGSTGTPYPKEVTLTLGARRYVKLGQNPDADISQDEALFQKRLSADIAAHQVPGARKRRRSAYSQSGTYTGDF